MKDEKCFTEAYVLATLQFNWEVSVDHLDVLGNWRTRIKLDWRVSICWNARDGKEIYECEHPEELKIYGMRLLIYRIC